MSLCPITYQELPRGTRYSRAGLRRLSPGLKDLRDLPYSAEEQRQEAVARASTMSIQGDQPKLSARLNPRQEAFELVDTGGRYILKPQTDFPEIPQNEDLTMRLAEAAGIEVPFHGLVYSKDGTLTYFVKRFDRTDRNQRLAVEDFAQLSGRTRETKYDSSMEEVVAVIDRSCTFPAVERLKLLRLTFFNFLVGNEEMHLKNFSLIRREGKIELSPAYDLVNTAIALPGVRDDIALPLGGKKRNLSLSLLFGYFGRERLRLPQAAIDNLMEGFSGVYESWERLLGDNFLSGAMKGKYRELIARRWESLGSSQRE